jgi:hypothetical protein
MGLHVSRRQQRPDDEHQDGEHDRQCRQQRVGEPLPLKLFSAGLEIGHRAQRSREKGLRFTSGCIPAAEGGAAELNQMLLALGRQSQRGGFRRLDASMGILF